MIPKLSLVIGAYNMPRELPRTIRSLSPQMQVGVGADDYELIVVDNGSTRPFDRTECESWGANLTIVSVKSQAASASPVEALNRALALARGYLVGAMIDGARLASPGLVASALAANRVHDRAVILTLGFHLGHAVQMESVRQGYDQAAEDRLLEQARWFEDGYRLFGISVFAGSSRNGWFRPINESNAIFMRRSLWDELGGFEPRFASPGGGYANFDLLSRAVDLPGSAVITLLGEGTFHQVHGGVATNALDDVQPAFGAEFVRIRGRPHEPPEYRSLYCGTVPPVVLESVAESARWAAALDGAAQPA